MDLVYLDHAATSFPKAPGVPDEAARFLREDAGNAGRGVYGLARRAADAVEGGRLATARLLGVGDAARLALVPGATAALNQALWGLLEPGERVLVGPEAHNSVLRPLARLARERKLTVEEVAADDALRWDLADLERRLAAGPAALVCVSHGSNVTGAVQDLAAIARLAGGAGARVLVDAAQTAGALPLDLDALGVDLVAFSGHKALLGPTGIGGLFVRAGVAPRPLLLGGTGTASDSEEPPVELPTALEPGTPNSCAAAALAVAVAHVAGETPAAIHARTAALGARLRAGLAELPGVELFAADGPDDLPVVAFRVAGWDPAELAVLLDASAGVAVRPGLHCAPRAHRRLGTLAGGGTLRASVGPFLDEAAVDALPRAIRELA